MEKNHPERVSNFIMVKNMTQATIKRLSRDGMLGVFADIISVRSSVHWATFLSFSLRYVRLVLPFNTLDMQFAFKKLHNTRKIREDLIIFLTPNIAGCSTFCCSRGKEMPAGNKHNEQLAILIFESSLIQCLMDTQQH